jgi:phosphatidylglycerophosphate synthase
MPTMTDSLGVPRRVLATRRRGWARALANGLATAGVRPNTVSIAGVLFAAACAGALLLSAARSGSARSTLLVVAAALVQLRLLSNLLDGMLAVEHGLKSAAGEIFNDLPDRVSDAFILIGVGYATPEWPAASLLGWSSALTALFTAYVRVLGGSIGATQQFVGPMAKQHRMFTVTLAMAIGCVEVLAGRPPMALPSALAIVTAGSIGTSIRRTARVLREVNVR